MILTNNFLILPLISPEKTNDGPGINFALVNFKHQTRILILLSISITETSQSFIPQEKSRFNFLNCQTTSNQNVEMGRVF
jgi:hypothetical protein